MLAITEKLAARVSSLLGNRSDVTERRMFGGLTFMVRGHMCCGVHGEELILRLGPEAQTRRSPAHTPARWTSPADRSPASSR